MIEDFPFDVTLPDGRSYTQTKLLIVNGHAHVFWMWGGEPKLVASAMLAEPVDPRRELRRIHTADGVWETLRSADCGCRNALKRIARRTLLDLIEAA